MKMNINYFFYFIFFFKEALKPARQLAAGNMFYFLLSVVNVGDQQQLSGPTKNQC